MADEYRESTYGYRIAEVYDDWPGVPRDSALAADFLADLAGRGPALELGIGTRRIALLLRERGVEVHGIDASEAIVAKLRGKAGNLIRSASPPNGTSITLLFWAGSPFVLSRRSRRHPHFCFHSCPRGGRQSIPETAQ
jgi:hypothetical protein